MKTIKKIFRAVLSFKGLMWLCFAALAYHVCAAISLCSWDIIVQCGMPTLTFALMCCYIDKQERQLHEAKELAMIAHCTVIGLAGELEQYRTLYGELPKKEE